MKIGEVRTGKAVGQVQSVLLSRREGYPTKHMMAMPAEPKGSGQFFFDGRTVYFHEDDEKFKKFIVYESVQQVQRTVGKSKKVRLRP